MYVSYDNLWKLLIDRKLCKTDLIRLTGMSSRTLAKLSKNQSVTTDTLLQICGALGCGVSDIMEVCEGEPTVSLYEAFRRDAAMVSEDEHTVTYRLSHGGHDYVIRKTKKTAGKRTVIRCEKRAIVWEQIHPLSGGWSPERVRTVIGKVDFFSKNEIGIFLIDGAPSCIEGLDEDGFISARGVLRRGRGVYVMSLAAFRVFAPKGSSET